MTGHSCLEGTVVSSTHLQMSEMTSAGFLEGAEGHSPLVLLPLTCLMRRLPVLHP